MDDKLVIAGIARALVELEQQGELVLTTSCPEHLARVLFQRALEGWFNDTLQMEDPIECTLPHLLEQTVKEIMARFGLPAPRARQTANAYYQAWLATRTMAEIAEIYWHETPHEIAARAYYHIELGRPDDRDLDYLNWRQGLRAE